MNLEDLAKQAIDEVSTQLSQNEEQELKKTSDDLSSKKPEAIALHTQKEKLETQEATLTPSTQDEKQSIAFNEELFLKNLKERLLVLFEGLNRADHTNLEARLKLTINFLEFLLANIDDKLKK